jgi:hypothetical protein
VLTIQRALSQQEQPKQRGKEWDAVLPDMCESYESAKPRINKSLTGLLKGLACSTVDVVGEGVRAIRIGNDASFLVGDGLAGNTIYERSFYPQLVSAIRGLSLRVILISNPGTGKSVFQYYLLARYLNPSLFKDNDVPPPEEILFGPREGGEAPKVVIRHMPTMCMEVWFLEHQVVHVIESYRISISVLQSFDPATTLYFFEPGETTNIEPYGRMNAIPTLETVSPDPSRYKEFRKIASKAYMPVFTKNELVAIGRDMRTRPNFPKSLQALYTDEDIGARFDTFNGIIRHVLPQSQKRLLESRQERFKAIQAVDPLNFLRGDIEDGKVSHYLAVYEVARGEDGVFDFTSHSLKTVAPDVKTTLENRLNSLSLMEKIYAMRLFSQTGMNKFSSVATIYESLVADHLLSDYGVSWKQRRVVIADSSVKAKTGPRGSKVSPPDTVLFAVKLTQSSDNVPRFEDMKPNVLYRSLNKSFPFCDMLFLYQDPESGKTRLVCVQVSIEGKGKRSVGLLAFQDFCKRLGWDASQMSEMLGMIMFVYCPLPALANKAAVTFDEGVKISEYTVWHVDPNFSAVMSM